MDAEPVARVLPCYADAIRRGVRILSSRSNATRHAGPPASTGCRRLERSAQRQCAWTHAPEDRDHRDHVTLLAARTRSASDTRDSGGPRASSSRRHSRHEHAREFSSRPRSAGSAVRASSTSGARGRRAARTGSGAARTPVCMEAARWCRPERAPPSARQSESARPTARSSFSRLRAPSAGSGASTTSSNSSRFSRGSPHALAYMSPQRVRVDVDRPLRRAGGSGRSPGPRSPVHQHEWKVR